MGDTEVFSYLYWSNVYGPDMMDLESRTDRGIIDIDMMEKFHQRVQNNMHKTKRQSDHDTPFLEATRELAETVNRNAVESIIAQE